MPNCSFFTRRFTIKLPIPAAIICIMTISPALAAAPQEVVDHYVNACLSMTKMAPINGRYLGDSDLHDSLKLKEYCTCFGTKFADRAVTKTAPAKSREEITATQQEELQMRNSCRKEYGLPLVQPKP